MVEQCIGPAGDSFERLEVAVAKATECLAIAPAEPIPVIVEARPLAVARAVVWNQIDERTRSTRSAVRTVSQLTPVDPFEEPYPAGQEFQQAGPQRPHPTSEHVPDTLQSQSRASRNATIPFERRSRGRCQPNAGAAEIHHRRCRESAIPQDRGIPHRRSDPARHLRRS